MKNSLSPRKGTTITLEQHGDWKSIKQRFVVKHAPRPAIKGFKTQHQQAEWTFVSKVCFWNYTKTGERARKRIAANFCTWIKLNAAKKSREKFSKIMHMHLMTFSLYSIAFNNLFTISEHKERLHVNLCSSCHNFTAHNWPPPSSRFIP